MYVPKTKYEVLKEIVRQCRNEQDDVSYLGRSPLPFLHLPQRQFHILCGSLGTSESVYEMLRQLINDEPASILQMHYFPENDVNGNMIVAIAVAQDAVYYCGGMTDFSGTGGAARQWMLKSLSVLAELSNAHVEQIYHNQPLDEMWKSEIQ